MPVEDQVFFVIYTVGMACVVLNVASLTLLVARGKSSPRSEEDRAAIAFNLIGLAFNAVVTAVPYIAGRVLWSGFNPG